MKKDFPIDSGYYAGIVVDGTKEPVAHFVRPPYNTGEGRFKDYYFVLSSVITRRRNLLGYDNQRMRKGLDVYDVTPEDQAIADLTRWKMGLTDMILFSPKCL